MVAPVADPPGGRARHLLVLTTPALWPAWPFLPVVRRRPGRADDLGVVFDPPGAGGRAGGPVTVYRANLFALPPTLAAFLALPRESYPGPDEVVAAGWAVD